MEDPKSRPWFLVLLLALLGLATLPKGLTSDNSSSSSGPLKGAAGAATTRESSATESAPRTFANPDLAVLAPVFALTHDGSRQRISERDQPPRFDRAGRIELVKEILARVERRGGKIRPMIALLPDPVRTSASQDFDSQLDGIERAAEAAGFVLADSRFPWDETEKNQAAERKSASLESSQSGVGVPWAPRLYDQPGLLVFRKAETLLAMFLVLETPTRGLRKHQFNWSLDFLEAFADSLASHEKPTGPRSFHILGPRYTGTARSLNQAIDGWLTRAPAQRLVSGGIMPPVFSRSYRFSIAAAATEINGVGLRTLPSVERLFTKEFASLPYCFPKPARPDVEFRSAMNRRNDVTVAMTGFIQQEFGDSRIAMLVESNTGLGSALLKEQQKDIAVYQYPLHIASLRASYEKQGLLGDPGGQVFHSAGRLELAPEENERRLDVVTPATPDFSTRVDELVMVQTMTEIARQISLGRYTAVGIAGSSSLDVIFLAQLVNKYSPDAVLFTNLSDLLFTQPQTISYLRGMLIGSSYPLYAPNRHWSYPYGEGAKAFFSHESVQAVFNSTTLLLAEVFADDDEVRAKALPLEFSRPFEAPDQHPRPPIWIGIVGNRGIYPIAVRDGPEREKPEQWPALHASTKQVPLPFEASYHPFWKILEGVLLMLGGALFCLALLECWWVLARINHWDLHRWRIWRDLKRLAAFLVWSRVSNGKKDDPHAKAPRSSAGHGPGILLVLAHFTFLLSYVTVNQPFLFPAPRSWLKTDAWSGLATGGYRVALVSLVLSLVAWFSLAVEKRAIRGLALLVPVIVVTIVSVLVARSRLTYGSSPATYLALERIVAVTSGVSPTFPVVFVGLAAMSFFAAQFKRRYLNEQFSMRDLKSKRPSPGERPVRRLDVLAAVEEKIDELKEVIRKLSRVFRLGDLIPTFILLAYVATLAGFGLRPAFSARLGEGDVFTIVFWGLFSFLSIVLAFHVYLVFVLWSHLKAILAQVSRLPLARSFERMPARVARWFFESPRPQNRSAMIEDQARALAGRCAGVRPALERVHSHQGDQEDGVSPAEWASLPKRLMRINDHVNPTTAQNDGGWKIVRSGLAPVSRFIRDNGGFLRVFLGKPAPERERSATAAVLQGQVKREFMPPETAVHSAAIQKTLSMTGDGDTAGANVTLNKILNLIWYGRPLTWTFAEGKVAAKIQEEAGAGWPILPATAVELLGKPENGEKDILAGVREWIEMAEDLVTLQLLRHLSQFLAHIWVMVRFIVIGSLTLLLAINSYPFPLQYRIGFLLAILIAVAAWAILRLVIGINRDETISRVANTMAGFKLDHNLASAMMGYILPLIGILAAVSYDMSDLLRVWLDPVFRILR
jgi:hypothetical protein